MNLVYNLPVYKTGYNLLTDVFQVVKHFPKEYKYTLGERLKDETLSLLTSIYRANVRLQKHDILQTAREHIEVVRLLMRLTKEMDQITLKQFVRINALIESISKQLTAWQKKYTPNREAPPST